MGANYRSTSLNRRSIMFVRSLVLALLLPCVTSFPMYQMKIPNGDSVPDPCNPNQTWPGVGHLLKTGTNTRNPFGLDFAAANHTWTVELCQKDSDGDGRSNGAELGDPQCVWKENAIAAFKTNLSHPGVCEPLDNTACKQRPITSPKYNTQEQWMADVCKSGELNCPALKEPGTKNITVRLPLTKIPAKETTYECMIFNLLDLGIPSDSDVHLIGVTPVIDNSKVLHHMVMTACTDSTLPTSQPYECGMSASMACQEMIHVWTVGLPGECYHSQSGMRLGLTGYKIVAIQLHWNNPSGNDTLSDSSGLLLHYTDKMRPYDAGIIMIGSANFYLPPKKERVVVEGLCGSGCTNQMLGPINVTSVWNHMHYAGREMMSEVRRNGSSVLFLTNENDYSYDLPKVFLYDIPIVLQPKDEIHTTCVYNTMNKNKTTVFGEATSDEMCFIFMTYYPKQNWKVTDCMDINKISMCDPEGWGKCKNLPLIFERLNETTIFKEVSRNCQPYFPCLEECTDTLVKYMNADPCLQGDVWIYIQKMLQYVPGGEKFRQLISSCKAEVYMKMNPAPTCPTITNSETTDNPDSAAGTTANFLLILLSASLATIQLFVSKMSNL